MKPTFDHASASFKARNPHLYPVAGLRAPEQDNNVRPQWRRGRKLTEETKRKLSESHKLIATEDWKKKQSIIQKGLITPEYRQKCSERSKVWLANHPHPRGMLGKHQSKEHIKKLVAIHTGKKLPTEQIIRRMKTNLVRYGVTCAPNKNPRKATWKSGWVIVGDQKFFARSSWEVGYARFLEWKKGRGEIIEWQHEPKTFWFDGVKRGCVSYKPDFEVRMPEGLEYHEVKGWMDTRSRTTLQRMEIYYPEVNVVLIDAKRYRAIMKWQSLFPLAQVRTEGQQGTVVKIELT